MMGRIQAALLVSRARAIDVVYRELDDHMLAGRFDEARAGMLAIADSDLPLSFLLSALTISLPWVQQTREARARLVQQATKLAILKGDADLSSLRGLLDMHVDLHA